MRYGIPLLANRIAPRCTSAESVLVVELAGGEVRQETLVPSRDATWPELVAVLSAHRVDAVVCGGIPRPAREELRERGIAVVENVAATADAVLAALLADRLHPGFGFVDGEEAATRRRDIDREVRGSAGGHGREAPRGGTLRRAAPGDCLACLDRACLRGAPCHLLPVELPAPRGEEARILEAAHDISGESERTLCRLSELVYFGLELGYHRLGVAFCWDLLEPTRILVGVLRRFFAVTAVGCWVGGQTAPDPTGEDAGAGEPLLCRVVCNPRAQARVLDVAGCDLNVTVGLCMGADCVFNQASRAPVTALFVKDRSLANNPIGALYSDHYLKEALQASVRP
ncbi:MAG: DUF1847 domain-containing protein [Candidatus Krumholzibacteriia bacterium]